MNGAVWRSRLLSGHWFSGLPAGLQDGLLDAVKLRRLTPGRNLFRRGDAPCGLYVVVEGVIRIGDEQVKPTLPSSIELPYWFGEVSLFDGLPRTQNAFSRAHSIVLHVPQTELARLLEKQPTYRRQFASLLKQKLLLSNEQLEQHSQLSTAARVAFCLLLIAQGYGAINFSPRLIGLPATQLARWLSISRPTMHSVLLNLQAKGVLSVSECEIRILDLDKLRAAAT
jgi:CRP-like cAMP-binding protein